MSQAPPGSILQQFQPGGYATTHLLAGPATHGGALRQPDFIQPTAPFQTQAQPPLPHTQPQHFPQQAIQRTPAQLASAPLTTLRADLQPLLTHGMPLTHTFSSTTQGGGPMVSSLTATQLEDAQRLLFQQSILAGLPRLGAASAGGESSLGAGGAGGGLAHMGMGAEASALVAAAAGLRTQTADGEEDSSSGASVVAIDNKIEQAMDLVKSHLMYAVREEVEVLKEQIKELIERNSQLEQENTLLKTLASPEQMAEFQAQVQSGSPTGISQPPTLGAPPQQQQPSLGLSLAPSSQSSGTSG
ncbi:TSC22 domain family protein 1-like isoform 1-T1 [Aplochiton taeniatus]